MKAKGQLRERVMNKPEQKYVQELDLRLKVGEISWWNFECVKFRLATIPFTPPDFLVLLPDGQLQAHEVKGFCQDDARVKIKGAAEHFPVKFVAATHDRQGWKVEEF